MKIFQADLTLRGFNRGFHVITQKVLNACTGIREIETGICHVFIRHTSASLSLNEAVDPSVRKDFESWFNKQVRENDPVFTHDSEGPDDMPAHLKASLLGSSVTIPITNGSLALGTWQGIYFCEHRDNGGERSLVITAWGN